jgi:hypothetical protein
MSSIFWYYLFIFLWCLFLITTVRSQRLRESPGAQRARHWAATSWESRQVFLDHVDPICFLPLVTHLHGLIGLPIPYISIGSGLWLVDLLSHAVMRIIQVFPSLWSWVWLVSLLEVVSHLSRCDLTLVRIDVVVWARLGWWRWLDSINWCGLSCLNLLRTES